MALANEALQEEKMSQVEAASIQKLQLQAKAAAEKLPSDKGAGALLERLAISSDQQEGSKSSAERMPREIAANVTDHAPKPLQSPDSKTSLEATEDEGRHLVASKNIRRHEKIYSEEASCAVVTKSHRKEVIFKHL